jgi:hypothetical protein
MKGHCGSNSISSTSDLAMVTCLKCKELLREQNEMNSPKISFEDWMVKNGIIWSHLREADKRAAVKKWKAEA